MNGRLYHSDATADVAASRYQEAPPSFFEKLPVASPSVLKTRFPQDSVHFLSVSMLQLRVMKIEF